VIVTGSSFVKRTLVDHGVDAKKIRVNPYGVDCERFHVDRRDNSRPFRFLYAGPVNSRKGLPLLIDAWRGLAGTGAELWRIGSGSEQDRKRIPNVKGLRDLGRVSDVSNAMRQCDVFVLPTYFEGFALVILEAMASGLPVITTTASGAVGVLTEGEDGWLLDPGDLPKLTEKMNYCLEHQNIARAMGRQARATAERYTWSAYGERWMSILQELRC
jgi:glycosyltransferase involved in cell wall biosynthesis